jgi:FKBP-type peptidyl-prolyl cis-trans isomerase SlyD
MKIAVNTVVYLRYVMKNNKGEVLENILNSAPVSYLHGSGNLLPALESSLEGSETGQKKSISISSEMSSQAGDQFHFDILIDNVRPATEEELKKRKPIEKTAFNNCGPDCC